MTLKRSKPSKQAETAVKDLKTAISERAQINKLLGITARDTRSLMNKIEKGFAFDAFRYFQKSTGLQDPDLKEVIGIKPRTFDRRKTANRFTTAESDRLVSIARIFVKATTLFEGDKDAAGTWLTSPSRAFGNVTPLEMARTETGTREVEKLIGRLEHGVFT